VPTIISTADQIPKDRLQIVYRLLSISVPRMLSEGESIEDIRYVSRHHVALFIHGSDNIPDDIEGYIAQHTQILDPIIDEAIRRAKAGAK
jgi:hypothetical protein